VEIRVSALALLSVAVVLNNQNGWYANWGDLIGSRGPNAAGPGRDERREGS